jgi:hypothetical protein
MRNQEAAEDHASEKDDRQNYYAVVSWRSKFPHLLIQKFPVASSISGSRGRIFYFFTRIGLSLRNHTPFGMCTWAIYFDPRVGTFDRRNVYIEKGRTAVAYASLAQ